MDMHEIRTKRLLLRPFRELDYDENKPDGIL